MVQTHEKAADLRPRSGRLTHKEIESIRPTGKKQRFSIEHGLHLEVDPKGRKYWNWRYYWPPTGDDRKQVELRIGPFPRVTLKAAKEARAKLDEARRQGLNPRLLHQSGGNGGSELNASSTFAQVAEDWLSRQGDWTAGHLADVKRKLRLHILPIMGEVKVSAVNAPLGRTMVAPLEAAGKMETARKALTVTSQVLDHAVVNGWIHLNPLSKIKTQLVGKSVKGHFPSISWKDVQGFWEAAEEHSHRMDAQTYNALRLQALTFVRHGGLIRMRWEEIDWERERWVIPAERMKGRRGYQKKHIVPLSTQALAVLRHQRQITGHHDLVFRSNRSGSGHLSNNTVNQSMKRFGFSGKMCTHGFRSLAMTALQEEKKIDRIHIDRQLAHGPENKVQAAYNAAEYIEERIHLMQVWGDMLEQSGMIVPRLN